MTRRAYQKSALQLATAMRTSIWFWCRQSGKTTTESQAALLEMMRFPGRLVTYATATLLLGRELILKETEVLQSAIGELQVQARDAQLKLEVHDRDKAGKDLSGLGRDDFAELFESKRLEFWLRHDRSRWSRTQVIAPSVATARGWTGTVLLDEIGHIPDFRDLWTAMEPIISSSPDFRLIMAGTPPEDDAHFSFEMFAPPVGMEFQPNAKGNQFKNEFGIQVLRVDVDDAVLAGKRMYDLNTGKEISTVQHRRQAPDRDGWDRNYKLALKHGGTSAVNALRLKEAQELGAARCKCVVLEDDSDLDSALEHLASQLTARPVGLGWDLATTEQEKSNPSALVVMERNGTEYPDLLVLVWKTADPDKAARIVGLVLDTIEARTEGGRARRLCIDATNERYFAQSMRKLFGRRVPVELVVSSETIELPGEKEPMTIKAWLGNQLVNAIDDVQVPLPPERYLKEDFRLVKRDRGTFATETGPEGQHGDTFDGTKLALKALSSVAGAILDATGIMVGKNASRIPVFRPARLQPMATTEIAPGCPINDRGHRGLSDIIRKIQIDLHSCCIRFAVKLGAACLSKGVRA